MQGNASRDNVRTPKHALRLLFKSRYGPTRLDHDWFGGSVHEFNTVVLRACFTDSWSTRYSDPELVPGFPWRGQRYRPEDSLLLRDVWVKDSLSAVGRLFADTQTDTDGDGLSDADEFIAGTDPLDPRSVLSLRWTFVDSEEWSLLFTAVAGRSYAIESAPRTPVSTWEISATWPAASTNRTISFPVTNSTGPARFFRVRVDFP